MRAAPAPATAAVRSLFQPIPVPEQLRARARARSCSGTGMGWNRLRTAAVAGAGAARMVPHVTTQVCRRVNGWLPRYLRLEVGEMKIDPGSRHGDVGIAGQSTGE